jgi:hypothetical protein
MPRTPKHTPTKSQQGEQPESEDAIVEPTNKALKRMMDTPPEAHQEMLRRRRSGAHKLASKRGKK